MIFEIYEDMNDYGYYMYENICTYITIYTLDECVGLLIALMVPSSGVSMTRPMNIFSLFLGHDPTYMWSLG